MKEIDVSWAAREYQRSDESDGTTATAFEDGAEWMRKELTHWNDPTMSLLEVCKEVLLKMKWKDGTNHYVVGWLTEKGRFTTSVPFVTSEIEGWRYIHE